MAGGLLYGLLQSGSGVKLSVMAHNLHTICGCQCTGSGGLAAQALPVKFSTHPSKHTQVFFFSPEAVSHTAKDRRIKHSQKHPQEEKQMLPNVLINSAPKTQQLLCVTYKS
ncbi:hypothetical protein KIL84_015799 [Mauremys mutica]|uniref:Uncharacterized protein n=1 Tax=Mauremys mutica TaxID=74926 RepID=A0A9D3WR82_9SAUR|nr:hypothetical protein KIL84_015799 [Mauremys mutica]